MRFLGVLGVGFFVVLVSACQKSAPSSAPRPESRAVLTPAADAGFDPFAVATDGPPVVQEAVAHGQTLDTDIKKAVADAHKDGRRVFVYFGATWCGPCRLLKHAFERGNNRKTFANWVLVRVNVDELPDGPALGVPFNEIPFLIKLDEHGKVAGTLSGRGLGDVTRPASVDATLKKFLAT